MLRNSKMLALLFVAILSTALAVPAAERILGGNPTTIEQYPFMANVLFLNYPTCGGTLINNRSVLTAANCITIPIPTLYDVVLGETLRLGNGGAIYPVSQIIVHPGYINHSPGYNFDAVILRLSSTVIYSNSIAPARIGNFFLPDGAPLQVLGWGFLTNHGPSSGTLREVTVNYVEQKVCSQRYSEINDYLEQQSRFPPITSDMLCAGALDIGGKGFCYEDAGGPLVTEGDIVVGIASWRHWCGSGQIPDVYARVAEMTSWISDNA